MGAGHGFSGHPLYKVLTSAKQRCYNPNVKKFEHYGGRGISVCDEWRNDTVAFIEWCLNNGYKKGLTIDREDNDGNYSPDNCRFVTIRENNKNKRLLRKDNTSGYRGVNWAKNAKKWHAQIKINNKNKYLGYFNSPRLAALRYDVEVFLLGCDRPMNFVEAKNVK